MKKQSLQGFISLAFFLNVSCSKSNFSASQSGETKKTDAPSIPAQMQPPIAKDMAIPACGIAFDGKDKLYAASEVESKIFAISLSSGQVTTFAGTGEEGFGGDNGPALEAKFNRPQGIAFDKLGNLYVGDQFNNRLRIITPSRVVSTIVSGDTPVNSAAAASGEGILLPLSRITESVVDSKGVIYFSDYDNAFVYSLHPDGKIRLVGGANLAQILLDGESGKVNSASSRVAGLALDSTEQFLYFTAADLYIVGKVNLKSGLVTRVAGTGVKGLGPDNVKATESAFNTPFKLLADKKGGLYISDHYGHKVRYVNSDGIVTTVIGNGEASSKGDGGLASAATVTIPCAMVQLANEDLLIGEHGSGRIRVVHPDGKVEHFAGKQ